MNLHFVIVPFTKLKRWSGTHCRLECRNLAVTLVTLDRHVSISPGSQSQSPHLPFADATRPQAPGLKRGSSLTVTAKTVAPSLAAQVKLHCEMKRPSATH